MIKDGQAHLCLTAAARRKRHAKESFGTGVLLRPFTCIFAPFTHSFANKENLQSQRIAGFLCLSMLCWLSGISKCCNHFQFFASKFACGKSRSDFSGRLFLPGAFPCARRAGQPVTITEEPFGMARMEPFLPSRASAFSSASATLCAGIIWKSRTISSGASEIKITRAFCMIRAKI